MIAAGNLGRFCECFAVFMQLFKSFQSIGRVKNARTYSYFCSLLTHNLRLLSIPRERQHRRRRPGQVFHLPMLLEPLHKSRVFPVRFLCTGEYSPSIRSLIAVPHIRFDSDRSCSYFLHMSRFGTTNYLFIASVTHPRRVFASVSEPWSINR